MSSILRALKKLENEPRHLEQPQALGNKFVPLADTGVQKKPAAIIMMVIGGGIICGIVILAGWWVFSEKNPSSPATPQEVSQQGSQQAEMAKASPEETRPQEQPAGSVGPGKPAADISTAHDAAALPPESTFISIPKPSPTAIVQSTAIPVDAQAAGPVAPLPAVQKEERTEQAPAEKITVAATRPAEVPTTTKEIEIPALKDPKMKLQAITWSKDPLKRVVVLNNRILRQGDSVMGYRIDSINQDDVVLNDAGEQWKLIFRIK